jgi:hypothetical protein
VSETKKRKNKRFKKLEKVGNFYEEDKKTMTKEEQ